MGACIPAFSPVRAIMPSVAERKIHEMTLRRAVEEGLKYAKSHEWAKLDGDTITVGISDFAQVALDPPLFASRSPRQLASAPARAASLAGKHPRRTNLDSCSAQHRGLNDALPDRDLQQRGAARDAGVVEAVSQHGSPNDCRLRPQ